MAADRHSFCTPSSLCQIVGNLPHTMSSTRLKSWSKVPQEASPVFGKVASKSNKPWRNNNLGFLLVETGHSCVSSKSVSHTIAVAAAASQESLHYHVCSHSGGGSNTDHCGRGGWRQMTKTTFTLNITVIWFSCTLWQISQFIYYHSFLDIALFDCMFRTKYLFQMLHWNLHNICCQLSKHLI